MDEDAFVHQATQFLEELLGDRGHGLTADDELIESGLLDSVSLLDFVAFIERLRGAPLQPEEINLQSLSTIRSSYALVLSVPAQGVAG